MKKSSLAIALTMALGMGAAQSASMSSATFDMYDPTGTLINVDTAVTGSIGGGIFSVASPTLFFGLNWTAHSGTTFGPGTYTIDTIQGGVYTGITVGAGQVGGHILFNWGATTDIDVVMVWDVVGDTYTSVDVVGGSAGDLPAPGLGMIDGAFPAFSANFSFVAPVPVPAAVWLFGSGLIGLIGVARYKKT